MTWMQRLAGVDTELSRLPNPSMRSDFWLETRRRHQGLISNWWFWIASLEIPVFILFVQPWARSLARLQPAAMFEGPAPQFDLAVLMLLMVLSGFATVALTRRSYRRALRTILNERGYPVCMACGYSLTGLDSRRCPECGHSFDAIP